jgi:hypothetical protein
VDAVLDRAWKQSMSYFSWAKCCHMVLCGFRGPEHVIVTGRLLFDVNLTRWKRGMHCIWIASNLGKTSGCWMSMFWKLAFYMFCPFIGCFRQEENTGPICLSSLKWNFLSRLLFVPL